MRRLALAGLAGLGAAGLGLFLRRRELLARALGLRPAEYAVGFEQDLPARMPDGVTLYADRYYPRGAGPFPTILIRTPYGRPSEARLMGPLATMGAPLFAERGYNVVVQGVRGRFRSEGRFEPFVHEAADGRATLEWVAAQPWFEGNLGMWGPSYLGYTQWAVAAEAPPYLKALVPAITTSRFSRAFNPGGAFAFETSLRWANILGARLTPKGDMGLAGLSDMLGPQRAAALEQTMALAPLGEADRKALGAPVPFYQTWLADQRPDGPFWSRADHHRSLSRVDVPVHLVAGWHDLFLGEQLADYTTLLAAGHTPYLTVLPRHHTDGAVIFEAVREGLWWLDAHLKGRRELLGRRPVRIALMGSREWHEMDFWPPPADMTRLSLHAGGALAATGPAADSPPSRYRFDPRDPTPSVGGPVLSPTGGPRDQRALEARPDLLCFTTSPLRESMDVIGPVRLELFVRSTLAHTDFVGRLCVVEPDGRSRNVCEGICRLQPGAGEPQPDGTLRIEIELGATAQHFRAGQRVRLHVCSSAYPRWSTNPGDGRPLAASGAVGLPAEQMIYHDHDHPSALVLPLVSQRTRERMASAARSAATVDAT